MTIQPELVGCTTSEDQSLKKDPSNWKALSKMFAPCTACVHTMQRSLLNRICHQDSEPQSVTCSSGIQEVAGQHPSDVGGVLALHAHCTLLLD